MLGRVTCSLSGRGRGSHDLSMAGAVAGSQPPALAHVAFVVAQGAAPGVANGPAGRAQDGVRRAGVPLLQAGRRVDVQVALAAGQQADLKTDAAAGPVVDNAKLTANGVHQGVAVRAAGHQTHLRWIGHA